MHTRTNHSQSQPHTSQAFFSRPSHAAPASTPFFAPAHPAPVPDVQAAPDLQERETSLHEKEALTFGQGIAAANPVSAPALQAKLTIGTPGDRFEQEADAVADQVVQRMESGAISQGSAPAVQAKCAACQEEDEKLRRQAEPDQANEMLQAKTGASHEAVLHAVQQGLEARRGTGEMLNPNLRDEMEQAFQTDFSGVHIHTGSSAERFNQDLNARAFTHGQDIYFNTDEFRPEMWNGRHLLAHELTHVVQQSGADGLNTGRGNDNRVLSNAHSAGNGAPATIQRDKAGGGSTEFKDQVTKLGPSASGSGIIEGTVTRTETAPASGSQSREKFPSHTMRVRFDPADCSIIIPFGYHFEQAAESGDETTCADPPPPAAVPSLSPDAFNRLKASVLEAVNHGLNGWFDVRLSGGACPAGCAGRTLPIRVEAREDTVHPDKTITVVNRGGRADAATICARSWRRTTAVHEGGHQALGVGDEYPETDEKQRATAPYRFRPERVRRDYSAMGPEEHSRFAMFHKRHFNAVKVFLEKAFPGCTATLQAHPRPIVFDFRIVADGGYALLNRLPGGFFEFGARIGIPLDRLRRWEFVLGPQINFILADQGDQLAFLLGARLGLEGSTGEAGRGLTGGLFGEAGYGWFNSSDTGAGGAGTRSAWSAYGELGLGLGYRTPLELGDLRTYLRVEGAVGSALGAPGIIGPITREIESDPRRSHWFRLGVAAGLHF
jgi:hypothetical protein